MTTDQGDAEASMRALARDLVEELAAGQLMALANDFEVIRRDPDSDDPLELVSFQVRPFQRVERTKSGRVITEQVHGHSALREGLGLGEHLTENTSAGASAEQAGREVHYQQHGEEAWERKGQAAWKARGAAVSKLHEAIGKTHDRMLSGGSTQHHWIQHPDAVSHLMQARDALYGQGPGKPRLSEAYSHLAQAHQAAVAHVLPRATPEQQDEVRKHLDTIQGHMEALDKVAGTKPDMTRKITGSSGQQRERAERVRGEARAAVHGAAESGDTAAVSKTAQQHEGLVDPDEVHKAAQRAKQVADLRNSEVPPMPPYHKGAAAVYPQAAAAARATLPGGTLSGHESKGRAMPVAVQSQQHPAEAELARAQADAARYAQREEQRRQADLKSHVADMKAAEAAYRGVAPEGAYRPLSDAEFAAHKDFVASQVEKALRAGLATDKQYSLDGKGQVWTPQRALLHREIIKDYLGKQVNVPTQREALFMGGLPGAGKSTTLQGHPDISLHDYAVLNPDDFKEALMRRGAAPEVPGLSPLETAALVHEESAYLVDLAAHELERRGKNVAWDVTMKNHDITADRVRLLKHKGYRVHSVFVDVPVEKSADRVEARYRKGLEKYRKGDDPMGGRFIPRSVVLAGEDTPGSSRARTTFDKLRPEFAGWELHDGTSYPTRLMAKSGSASPGIPSVEALRKVGSGATEQEAHSAETGQTAQQVAGLTHTNPSGTMAAEESESR